MESNENATLRAEREFLYRGSLVVLLFWLIWSVGGHLFLVLNQTKGGSLEYLYLISAILAVMALNNRKYGTNHSIRFYDEYLIVPKLLNIWLWREEKIFYNDINEINFINYGTGNEKNFCEIEVKTDFLRYPIFGKKLDIKSFKEIYRTLLQKTKVPAEDFPNIKDESNISTKTRKWQGYLALGALLVSGWTIGVISISSKFQNLLGGGGLFIVCFFTSVMICVLISRKMKNVKTNGQKWQKNFLLFYIAIYAGIALTFSFVYINGRFDQGPVMSTKMVLVKKLKRQSKKGSCVVLKMGARKTGGRHIASVGTLGVPNGDFSICSKKFNQASKGDSFALYTKKGFLNIPWVSEVKFLEKTKNK